VVFIVTAETAQMVSRNVNYDVPALKKQIAKCQQIQKVTIETMCNMVIQEMQCYIFISMWLYDTILNYRYV